MLLFTVKPEYMINDVRLQMMECDLIPLSLRHIDKNPSVRVENTQIDILILRLHRNRHLILTKIIHGHIFHATVSEEERNLSVRHISSRNRNVLFTKTVAIHFPLLSAIRMRHFPCRLQFFKIKHDKTSGRIP